MKFRNIFNISAIDYQTIYGQPGFNVVIILEKIIAVGISGQLCSGGQTPHEDYIDHVGGILSPHEEIPGKIRTRI
jgi:hypothetical protein